MPQWLQVNTTSARRDVLGIAFGSDGSIGFLQPGQITGGSRGSDSNMELNLTPRIPQQVNSFDHFVFARRRPLGKKTANAPNPRGGFPEMYCAEARQRLVTSSQ
jgi:hypothetical protein